MGLLRVLAIFFIVYLVIKLIGRLLLPRMVKSFAERMNDRMAGMADQFNQQNDTRQEGDVTIENAGKSQKDNSDTGKGEYVDFEEVD